MSTLLYMKLLDGLLRIKKVIVSEKIDQVRVLKDDAGEWWLEFYANDIRHQVTIEDVMNGLASFVNMQVDNAALHERINDLEAAQQKDAAEIEAVLKSAGSRPNWPD